MENVSLSIVNLRSKRETALATNQIFLNKDPFFQRPYEAWDDKLRTRFIESIILNRATNPIWVVLNDDDNSEEILDGKHRITTALAFFNNDFCIQATHFMILEKDQFNKKFYKDLDPSDQAKIRNYNFTFNKLDSSYRNDGNKLQDMYYILNRSSITLNNYEFNKVILKPFYDIISTCKDEFNKTQFFNAVKDARGNVDSNIIEMFALSHELPSFWSSVAKLTDDWVKENLGQTSEHVQQYIQENTSMIEQKMKFMVKIISDFYQKNLFSTDKKTFKKFYLPYKFVVSRCCFFIKDYALFNRISSSLIQKLLADVLVDNIQSKLECATRNATFQRKMIEEIDKIIQSELNQEGATRRFSKKMIQDKLIEQKNMCPHCNLLIKEDDKYDGDHIIPWTAGGKTLPENLQVLHHRCHQLKSS
jgi:Protein of unknown function DUF262/HNH endonuclease